MYATATVGWPRRGLPRANADLAQAHARDHHRCALSHFHTPDNAGELVGPNTTQRRPSGWYTGQNVEEKA